MQRNINVIDGSLLDKHLEFFSHFFRFWGDLLWLQCINKAYFYLWYEKRNSRFRIGLNHNKEFAYRVHGKNTNSKKGVKDRLLSILSCLKR